MVTPVTGLANALYFKLEELIEPLSVSIDSRVTNTPDFLLKDLVNLKELLCFLSFFFWGVYIYSLAYSETIVRPFSRTTIYRSEF